MTASEKAELERIYKAQGRADAVAGKPESADYLVRIAGWGAAAYWRGYARVGEGETGEIAK